LVRRTKTRPRDGKEIGGGKKEGERNEKGKGRIKKSARTGTRDARRSRAKGTCNWTAKGTSLLARRQRAPSREARGERRAGCGRQALLRGAMNGKRGVAWRSVAWRGAARPRREAASVCIYLSDLSCNESCWAPSRAIVGA